MHTNTNARAHTQCTTTPVDTHCAHDLQNPQAHTLTKVGEGVGIDVARQVNWSLKVSVGNPAVRQPEALCHASLTGELPQHLH